MTEDYSVHFCERKIDGVPCKVYDVYRGERRDATYSHPEGLSDEFGLFVNAVRAMELGDWARFEDLRYKRPSR
jgi:hypothetical protein